MTISTFNEDLLGLNDFAKRLERFIDTEHDFVEGGLVVALSSKFGSGKSTFLKMWRSSLSESDTDKKRIVILLNAWESDYNGDPLFSIISTLAATLKQSGQSTNKLLEAAKDVGWFATAVGSQVVNKVTGLDPMAAGEAAKKRKSERQDIVTTMDAFSAHEKRKVAMDSLKKAISDIVSSANPRVLFLVDELDRCRPDYAITYLETIKHLFDIKGVVFILAADRQQLENSAKTAFGADLDFEEYYRKFVHREVMLPSIPEAGYRKLANQYVTNYLVKEGSRFCFMKLDRGQIDEIVEIIAGLKLTPRQIQEVFRILGHICETTKEKEGRLFSNIAMGSIAMAAFKVGAHEVFSLLGTRQLEPTEAVRFFLSIKLRNPKWWLALFFTGGGLRAEENEAFESVVGRSGLASECNGGDISYIQREWGRLGSNRFSQIHDNILHITQWN